MGEKTDALEPFYPDRIASRILGMGDILSLVEELERKVDKEQAERLAKKLNEGKGFNLEDFRLQLIQMKSMGGVASLMDKLPGMGNLPPAAKAQAANDKSLDKMLAVINSMTLKERKRPQIIQGSRKRRIAMGSGNSIQEVLKVLKQYDKMQQMMKKMGKKGGLQRMMRGVKGLQNLIPGGDLGH
jgi:signal recognition particle subunit SRP54